MGKADLRIDWATHEAAKYACENWHYSKCLPIGKLVKVGAWEAGAFIGVVLFGRGTSPQLGSKYSLGQDKCVELVRVALKAHATPVSRIMTIATKFLKHSNQTYGLSYPLRRKTRGIMVVYIRQVTGLTRGRPPLKTSFYLRASGQRIGRSPSL